jgi:TolA-binding protein
MFRSRFLCTAAALLFVFPLALSSAHAESKDMIQLQTQIQQLQDAIARLQQSNDERMGVLKDLVQQTADSMNKMVVVVDGMKLQLQNVQDANTAKSDQLSGQIQSLNDSLDELKARLGRMDKALGDIQGQQQSTNALLNNLAAPASPAGVAPAPLAPVAASPATTRTPPPVATRTPPPAAHYVPPTAAAPLAAAPAPLAAPTAAAPVTEMYRAAYSDYMGAKYPLAMSEFADLIKAYPDDNLAGNAFFYTGEIDVRTGKLTNAVKSYDQVLERYPDNNKIPAAHLHKALALISMRQNDAGVRELRALIQRFPNSPEASQARSKLASMKVSTREPQ